MNRFSKNVKFLLLVSFINSLMLVSCKPKTVVVDLSKKDNLKKVNNIIENYYNNIIDFSTLYIKASIQYATDKQKQNLTAEIKLKKDDQILVSIRFLGITMAKVLIKPTQVSYYEKINSSFYEGDFSTLNQLLGTDLDFNKLQNLLIGRAIDNLKEGKYLETFDNQLYRLDEESDGNTRKSFYINSSNFMIDKQEITQTKEERMTQIVYSNRKEFKEMILPLSLNINSFQKKGKTEINLEYNNVVFNEALSLSYSVPNDYKRIIIK